MALNSMNINDIEDFSSTSELCAALKGKYAKNYQREYKLTMIRNVCFINTLQDCTIQIPDHYVFKYTDEAGEHTVEEGTNTLTITGIASLFFHMKNS